MLENFRANVLKILVRCFLSCCRRIPLWKHISPREQVICLYILEQDNLNYKDVWLLSPSSLSPAEPKREKTFRFDLQLISQEDKANP